MDQLATLRLFVDVTRSGSFAATGRRLGLSPSAVTRRVHALERSLGVRLIQRTTRRHSLTEAGRVYLGEVQRILADLESAAAAVAELESRPRGVLRLTAPVVFGRLHVAPLLPRLMRRYPELDVALSLTDRLVDLVEESVDVAVRVAALADSSLHARRLATMRRVLCASPAYLARRGAPRSPTDLSRHECVTFWSGLALERWHGAPKLWEVETDAGREVVEVAGRLRTDSADVLLGALVDGLGVGLVPGWLAVDALERGLLRPVLPGARLAPVGLRSAVHAVYPSSRQLSPRVRAVLDFLGEAGADLERRVAEALAAGPPAGTGA